MTKKAGGRTTLSEQGGGGSTCLRNLIEAVGSLQARFGVITWSVGWVDFASWLSGGKRRYRRRVTASCGCRATGEVMVVLVAVRGGDDGRLWWWWWWWWWSDDGINGCPQKRAWSWDVPSQPTTATNTSSSSGAHWILLWRRGWWWMMIHYCSSSMLLLKKKKMREIQKSKLKGTLFWLKIEMKASLLSLKDGCHSGKCLKSFRLRDLWVTLLRHPLLRLTFYYYYWINYHSYTLYLFYYQKYYNTLIVY